VTNATNAGDRQLTGTTGGHKAMESTMHGDIKATVKDYILREFLPGESPDSLDDSTALITEGVLDSIATVKLVAFLEREFGVQLEPHELSADYLNYLPDIVGLVEAKRAAR
jgi:acyl carrier protein